MRPIDIEVALHYVTRAGDHPMLDRAPAWRETCEQFARRGLLRQGSPKSCSGGIEFHPTEGLKIYVEALKAVPLPVQKWVMP